MWSTILLVLVYLILAGAIVWYVSMTMTQLRRLADEHLQVRQEKVVVEAERDNWRYKAEVLGHQVNELVARDRELAGFVRELAERGVKYKVPVPEQPPVAEHGDVLDSDPKVAAAAAKARAEAAAMAEEASDSVDWHAVLDGVIADVQRRARQVLAQALQPNRQQLSEGRIHPAAGDSITVSPAEESTKQPAPAAQTAVATNGTADLE